MWGGIGENDVWILIENQLMILIDDFDWKFSSHSEDHRGGRHDWEVHSEWKIFGPEKNLVEKIFGKTNF